MSASSFPVVAAAQIGGAEVSTVDARELHSFLDVGRDFSNWIKGRIEQFGFAQSVDFEVFTETGENPSGGRPAKEYALTLDMAKELAMVENNDRGRRVRRYFIRCEQTARTGTTAPRISDAASIFASLKQIAHTAGIEGNQALIAASNGTLRLVGVDPLAAVGATHLLAPVNEPLLTPIDIGVRLGGMAAHKVNELLTKRGFQEAYRRSEKSGGSLYYEPTEAGTAAGGVMSDTGKKHGDGTPVRQLRWSAGIVERLRS